MIGKNGYSQGRRKSPRPTGVKAKTNSGKKKYCEDQLCRYEEAISTCYLESLPLPALPLRGSLKELATAALAPAAGLPLRPLPLRGSLGSLPLRPLPLRRACPCGSCPCGRLFGACHCGPCPCGELAPAGLAPARIPLELGTARGGVGLSSAGAVPGCPRPRGTRAPLSREPPGVPGDQKGPPVSRKPSVERLYWFSRSVEVHCFLAVF